MLAPALSSVAEQGSLKCLAQFLFKMFHMLFLLCSTISILDFDVIYLGVSFFYCLHEFASQYKLTGLQFKAW